MVAHIAQGRLQQLYNKNSEWLWASIPTLVIHACACRSERKASDAVAEPAPNLLTIYGINTESIVAFQPSFCINVFSYRFYVGHFRFSLWLIVKRKAGAIGKLA
jgi:hypothetical protein